MQDLAVPLVPGLPAPPTGQTIAFIGLGRGTQNYTCGNESSDKPVSNGAKAVLFDMGSLLDGRRPLSGPFLDEALKIIPKASLRGGNGLGLPVLGHHFFNAALKPVFVVKDAQLVVKKVGSAPAPSDALPNSVDWLALGDNGSSTGGLLSVYRVETAGGKAPDTCEGKLGEFTVEYAAEYWFLKAA